jgi:hypothetical protein
MIRQPDWSIPQMIQEQNSREEKKEDSVQILIQLVRW